jgi:hypothetical protein
MTNQEMARTFFPGVRKEVFVNEISLLESRAGEVRIRLKLRMPLSDGKQTGMPEWVGIPYEHMVREGSVEGCTKYTHELPEMALFCHTNETQTKPSQSLLKGLLSNFSMKRGPDADDGEELGGIWLEFAAHIPDNSEAWSWFYRHRKPIWMRFESMQMDLPLNPKPAESDQLPLMGKLITEKGIVDTGPVGDQFDGERRQDLSPARDAEFEKPAKGKKEPVLQ